MNLKSNDPDITYNNNLTFTFGGSLLARCSIDRGISNLD